MSDLSTTEPLLSVRDLRVTYAGAYAVYRRARHPCPRCGTIVQMRRQGEQARSTYWCPKCQPKVPETRTHDKPIRSGP